MFTAREIMADMAEDFEVEVHEGYSGRGMYGARCFGISGDHGDLFALLMQTQSEIAIEGHGEIIQAPHKDSLGLGEIWYWPAWETV